MLLIALFILIVRPSEGRPNWDFVPLLIALCGPHWKFAAIGIPVVIFGLGCSVGLWFFRKNGSWALKRLP
jgi:hypothetical protein